MNFHNPFFPRHAFLFKGGASIPAGPVQAPPAPPAAETSTAVTEAKLDAKRQAKARHGLNSTILAGDTAGQLDAANPGGKSTVLGGG